MQPNRPTLHDKNDQTAHITCKKAYLHVHKTTKQHPHIMPQMNKDHTHRHSGGYLLASGSYTTIAALAVSIRGQ